MYKTIYRRYVHVDDVFVTSSTKCVFMTCKKNDVTSFISVNFLQFGPQEATSLV